MYTEKIILCLEIPQGPKHHIKSQVDVNPADRPYQTNLWYWSKLNFEQIMLNELRTIAMLNMKYSSTEWQSAK